MLLFLATPGILSPDGSLPLAVVALVPWALASARPGRRAFQVEWLAAAIGLSAQTYWSTYVLWLTLLAVAIVPATYMACAGVVLRRLAPRHALAIAVPVAWIGLETLRTLVEPPFGWGWMRHGHHAHAYDWLRGGLRVVGVGGVGFALAAVAGALADLVAARLRGGPRAPRPLALAGLGLGPILLVVLAGALTAPPRTVPGPRVLIVQPGFEQARKMRPPSADELFLETVDLTQQGLALEAAAGRTVDWVAWGETVFPYALGEPGLLAAFDRGARAAPWGQWQLTREDVARMAATERAVVAGYLYGGRGADRVLPAGTVFFTGLEEYVERDGLLRRTNAIVAWDDGGARLGRGEKVHLVPGGESLVGLERLAWVRETAYDLAGYVPDLVGADRVAVIDVPTRAGRVCRVGLSVCFDNAYDGPYTEPTRRGPLDLHLVASNEAWYRESFEYDQMMAFSRCAAAASGRSMVRATSSGISTVIGPDGGELGRIRDASGKDRMVAGSFACAVPIPDGPAGPTPYARWEPVWLGLWLALPLVLGFVPRRSRAAAPLPGRSTPVVPGR